MIRDLRHSIGLIGLAVRIIQSLLLPIEANKATQVPTYLLEMTMTIILVQNLQTIIISDESTISKSGDFSFPNGQ